jgi:hypothetical protein
VAAILYAMWPSVAFFVALVAVGPIAARRSHAGSDERATLVGALAGVSAALILFTLGALVAAGFWVLSLVLGVETASPWPVSLPAAVIACIGTAAGGGAAAFVHQVLSDWAEKG